MSTLLRVASDIEFDGIQRRNHWPAYSSDKASRCMLKKELFTVVMFVEVVAAVDGIFRCFVTQFPGELPHAQRMQCDSGHLAGVAATDSGPHMCVTSCGSILCRCLVHTSAHWCSIVSVCNRSSRSTQTQINSTQAQILPRRCVHADAEATSPHVSVDGRWDFSGSATPP